MKLRNQKCAKTHIWPPAKFEF